LTAGNLKIYSLPVKSPAAILNIAGDTDGNVWFGGESEGRLWRLRDDKFTALTTADGLPNVRFGLLLGDRAGHLWVGTDGAGLAVSENGRFKIFTTKDGLIENSIQALYEGRDGSIWIGTGSGMSRYKDGRFTSWTVADGLSSGYIHAFYEADDGPLWIATDAGGLNRFKDGKFAIITTLHGLYDNLAFQILESGGDLWMSGNRGIYRVSLQELNDFADGRLPAVNSYSYGTTDGMLSRECNGASPAGWKSSDGYLWFPTVKGLVRVNAEDRNRQPPAVMIEEVQVDNQSRSPDEFLRMTPEQESLEIGYTAISWTRPRQIRFKYRMEGLDREWTDAGTRRAAYYSHLPPGDYTFRVIADNGDGVWNPEGKSLAITVLPPFYRTWWFFALVVFSGGAVVVLFYHRRIGLIRRQYALETAFSRRLIDSQEQERKRFAAEMHDGLGQSFVIIKNRAPQPETARQSDGNARSSGKYRGNRFARARRNARNRL
jgi:ligand-binding sensor domain-containing protein